MKCVRCGYCCYQYDVIIIKPEFCVPEFKMSEVKEFMVMHKNLAKNVPIYILMGILPFVNCIILNGINKHHAIRIILK